MTNKKGKIVAIYGINNIGKTTQVKLTKNKLEDLGHRVINVKYPIYELIPTGPRINSYLREGNPENISAKEAQELYAINRKDSEKKLISMMDEYDYIILEDYTGTGLAWGIGTGVPKEYLLEINMNLLKEDISILMDGERFLEGEERNHKHENNSDLINQVRLVHLELAKEFDWKFVNANQEIDSVNRDILNFILN